MHRCARGWPRAHATCGTGCPRGRTRRARWRRRSRVFSADWLALREPADVGARSMTLARAVARSFDGADPLRALHLACGTGANVRYMADHIGAPQDWLLIDHDPALLDCVPACMSAWAAARGARIAAGQGKLRVTRDGYVPMSVAMLRADLQRLDAAAFFEG